MRYKYDYDGTVEGQTKVVAEHSDMTLVEVQDIAEGHFLVFSDSEATSGSEPTLETINNNLYTLMDALAATYEAVAAITTTTTTTT